jgi:hypothetical protein
MFDINETRKFWALPAYEQFRLFNTPCGDGWTCPTCGKTYRYHSGPPTSGGMHSCFVKVDGANLFRDTGCCRDEFSKFCFPTATRMDD